MSGVSFYIMTYNQEAFIADAVRAAFAQDYPGLEIVISDDGSTDNTWQVILDTVRDCQRTTSNRHTVLLNRNDHTLGICAHINKIVGICSHDIIVCSAGDDISRADRVSRIMDRFKASPEIMLVGSFVEYIDEAGNKIQVRKNKRYTAEISLENVASGKALPVGCAIACRRELYRFLGKRGLPEGCSYEDVILALRACLIGRAEQIPEPLVSYRVSDKSLTNFGDASPLAAGKKKEMAIQVCAAVRAQLEDMLYFIESRGADNGRNRRIVRILRHRLAEKEQSAWIYQYPLRKVLFLKLRHPFQGKSLFRYWREIVKNRPHGPVGA